MMKRHISDKTTMIYTGIIGTLSAITMLLVGVGFDVMFFGITAYSILMIVSIAVFFYAYAIQGNEITELTAEKVEKKDRKSHIFEVENYYYNLNKEAK
jgi:hypothetical protein